MAAVIEPGIYFIQNLGTGTVVDLANGSSVDGTITQGFQKRELSDPWVPAQLWVVSQVGTNPIYKIENANSRTFLTLTGGGNQTPVKCYAASNNDNQQWTITRANNNISYVIRNKSTGTYVDLYNGGSTNGTAVNGWAGSGVGTTNNHQLWLLVRA